MASPVPQSNFNSVLSCLAYSFCSASMILANKIVLGKKFYNFGHETLLIAIQNAIAVILLLAARSTKTIEFENFDMKLAKKWLPVNIFFILMLETSAFSMRYLPIHMLTVFKNVTNIGIVWGDWYFYKQPVSIGIICSLGIMLFGAVMGAYADLEFSAVGYFWMTLNCLATATYVLYMRYATTSGDIKLTRFGMVYYNNLISIPLCMLLSLFVGELFTVGSYPLLFDNGFWMAAMASGIVGVALNLSSYWCVSATSATTYATVGAVNKIPGIVVGVLFMSQVMDAQTGFYVATGLAGGFLYSYVKFQEAKKKKALEEEKKKNAEEIKKLNP